MKIFISITFLLVSAVSWVSCVQTLEGSEGGAVDITCEYPNGIEAETVLLMKINFSNNVIIIESKQREKTEGRFSLYHDSEIRYFIVTIHNLRREDAGIYKCGTAGYDVKDDHYTEINLEVKHAPPTSKSQLTTGSTSAHSTPTGYTLQPKYPTAPGLVSTSAYGNTNTADSGQTNHGGLVAAVLVTILLVLTVIVIILMKIRAKGKETPQSTQRNRSHSEEENGVYSEIKETDSSADTLQTPSSPRNQTSQPTQRNQSISEEENGVYSEIKDTHSSADKLQTPPTPSSQSQHQDGLPLTSVYTTVSLCPDLLPASTQAANRISGTTIEINDTNQNSEIDDTYNLATNPIAPTDMSAAANQNSEIYDTYHLATNPIPPTDLPAAANQNFEIDDTYHLATNPIPPTDLPAAANQNSEIDDTYHLATNPIPPTEMSAANQQLDSD